MSTKKPNIFISILENFILIAILLVLVQTFLEDFVIYFGFKPNTVRIIKLTAIIFDLIFSVEFIARMIANASKKNGVEYFLFNNGWIDLLSSIPLLLLVSGPYFINEVFGIDINNIGLLRAVGLVKLIKAIRVTRILRLLRVLKIFGKIKNVESVMAQRHISTISTIVIFSLILFFSITAVLEEVNVIPSKTIKIQKEENKIVDNFSKQSEILSEFEFVDSLRNTSKLFENVALVKFDDNLIYKIPSMESEQISQQLKKKDSSLSEARLINDRLYIVFSRNSYQKEDALKNMLNFLLIIFLLGAILIFYTKHFAQTVTDPIFVMRKGFEERDYTLAVKMVKHYTKDDIFILASDYNNRWLPAKVRKLHDISNKSSKLSFNDIFKK